jgi:hypothetical protein
MRKKWTYERGSGERKKKHYMHVKVGTWCLYLLPFPERVTKLMGVRCASIL